MRIGVVNDLPIAVEAIRRALAGKPQHRIVWVAHNGAEAVAQCARETPDLVLMDLLMPTMGGVEATQRIMAATPCAILVVTVNVGTNATRVFEAMGHGALDAIDTPSLGGADARAAATPFLAKLDRVERLLRDRNGAPAYAPKAPKPSAGLATNGLVAIGASAGGPAALMTVLKGLSKDFPAAIVVVQHVDQRFAPGMAEWLSLHSAMPVRLAVEGDTPKAGEVLVAGTNDHLIFKDPSRLGYTAEPSDLVYRPSVDVFFESVDRHWSGSVAGVLLTGMGRDGALGLKALRNKGCHTIAQDQATSAVYGMPKAAADAGAALEILPVDAIAKQLMNIFTRKA